ncbi:MULTISPECIES: hypothetical protein [Acinetobacter]|uniref:hypothetical protein n=1 Tax=Acinetobacter TaxID=469 RepID=UPI000EA36C8E|nr:MULTISPECIES: hypothetical protein [Acinetobacter]RKG44369.1 hypothetical protein D7V51_07710 [Acinetobacter cumulans]RZG57843.1 hypothetical protein EXE29_12685 [Acinetobacter sp. WCHAc060006]
MTLSREVPISLLHKSYFSRQIIHKQLMYNFYSTGIDAACGAGICHDAVALMHFLKKPCLSAFDFHTIRHRTGKQWINYFYSGFTLWDGVSDLPVNKAIGFTRPPLPNELANHQIICHSAYSVSNNEVRAINGMAFGQNGWKRAKLTDLFEMHNNGYTVFTQTQQRVDILISNR